MEVVYADPEPFALNLSWAAPNNSGVCVLTYTVLVNYTNCSTGLNEQMVPRDVGQSTSVQIDGLQPYWNYEVVVRAGKNGSYSDSEPRLFRTLPTGFFSLTSNVNVVSV